MSFHPIGSPEIPGRVRACEVQGLRTSGEVRGSAFDAYSGGVSFAGLAEHSTALVDRAVVMFGGPRPAVLDRCGPGALWIASIWGSNPHHRSFFATVDVGIAIPPWR